LKASFDHRLLQHAVNGKAVCMLALYIMYIDTAENIKAGEIMEKFGYMYPAVRYPLYAYAS